MLFRRPTLKYPKTIDVTAKRCHDCSPGADGLTLTLDPSIIGWQRRALDLTDAQCLDRIDIAALRVSSNHTGSRIDLREVSLSCCPLDISLLQLADPRFMADLLHQEAHALMQKNRAFKQLEDRPCPLYLL